MTQSFADPGTPQDGGSTRTASVDLTANVSGYTAGMADAAQQTGTLARGVDQLQSRMEGLNKWAGKKLFHFAAGDFAALAGATADAATFEKQLGTLSATAAVTGTSMRGIKNGIETAFTKFPVARGQVIDLVEAITNLGVTSSSSIGSLTQTFIKLGAATGEPMTQLAGGLIQLSRLMGSTDATQIGNYANSLLTVSKNAGVSASGVLDFAQSIAPIARQAGISEAAVLGISTAFSKAGADGFVATNAFNSIMSDISNSIATGSPELAKYANLIGMTTEQFKKADPTNSFVQIFQAIGKQGPQAIAILNSLGITGQRSQAAIAAITQSGDLQEQINRALASQGNQGNLNKGSGAAFSSLADSMIRVRNEFTQFGTEIGTTFLTPLTAAGNLAAKVAGHLNDLYKPFAPMLGALAGGAGVAAGAGSLALSAAGAIGTYALIRNVRSSRAVGAFRGGMNVGTPREDLTRGGAVDRYTAGQMGRMESAMFVGGTGVRGRLASAGFGGGAASPWRSASTWRNALVAGPLGATRMFSRANEQFLRGDMGGTSGTRLPLAQRLNLWGSSLQGRSMLDVASGEARPLARQLGATAGATTGVGMQMAGRFAQYGWRFAGPTVMGALVGGVSGIHGAGRLVNQGRGSLPTGDIRTEWAGVRGASAQFSTAFKGLRDDTVPLRTAFAGLGTASRDLAASLGRTGGTVLGAGIGQGVGAVGKVASGAATAARIGVSQVTSMLFSPMGMMSLFAGQKALSYSSEHSHDSDINKFLNPIQKYNDMLGTTTSNLANFNASLVDGAQTAGGAKVTSFAQAEKVTAADESNAPNKAKNKVFGDVYDKTKDSKGGSVNALAATLGTMQFSDPQQLHAAVEDMLAGGVPRATVQAALSKYGAAGGPDPQSGLNLKVGGGTKMLGVAAGQGGITNIGPYGLLGGRVNSGSARIMATALTGVDAQRTTDESTTGGVYAQQKALQSYTKMLSPLLNKYQNGSHSESAAALRELSQSASQITGGSSKEYQKYLTSRYGQLKTRGVGSERQFIDFLGATDQGGRFEGALKGKGTLDPTQMTAKIGQLARGSDESSFNSLLRREGGELGSFAASNKDVQYAMGSGQNSPGATNKSIDTLLAQAVKLGGGFDGAIAKLSEFQGAIGDTSSVLYKQVTAAQQLAVTQAGYQAPFESRAHNFGTAVTQYQQATSAYNNTPQSKRTDDQKALVQTTKANYEAALGEQQSYLQQMYQTAQSYGTQMKRGAEDEQTQIFRSNQQFHIQMQQSNEDYLTSRNRSQADHDRQLANQVATSAQTIYNPYQRVQAQYALSGGEVLDNLTDQNRRMHEQMAQVRKLHKEGLSTQAIQTLDLTNPANAQQTAGLASSLANNPEQINKINKQIGQRVKETKGLTQNAFSLGFAQAEKDYRTGLARAEADYTRATHRAEAAQQLSLSNMASDYNRTVKRAGEDLTTAMTEVTGQFGNMYDKTMGQIAASVAKFSPQAAAQMKKDLGSLVQAFPYLLTGQAANYGGSTQYIQTPGTMGINAQGKLGTYDKNGKFHAAPANTSVSPSANLPHIAPPVPAHALGGIATRAQQGIIGEAGPEAIIPLNERGQSFMATLIAKAFGQAMQMVTVPAHSTSSTSVDSSTNFTGPITVQAQDTRAFERDMKAKARLARLASPVRH